MPRVPIEDLGDPRIAMFRQLKATNLTRGTDQFVVEGEKLLDRLIESRYPLVSVLVTERHEDRIARRIPGATPIYVVPDGLIGAIVGFNFHRGVLATGRRCPAPGIEEIVRRARERLTIVICPELHNPENLGAIVRIGDVFGIDAVVVGGSCPDPLSRRVLRVSMGTALRLPVIVSGDLPGDVERLRSLPGFQLLATVLDPGAEPLDRVQRAERIGLLLGSEGQGLDPSWIDRCDCRVTIPMRPGAESLNVAVAAGVLLYHFMSRQGA